MTLIKCHHFLELHFRKPKATQVFPADLYYNREKVTVTNLMRASCHSCLSFFPFFVMFSV